MNKKSLGPFFAGTYAPVRVSVAGSKAPWDTLTGTTITMRIWAGTSPTVASGTLDAAGSDGKVTGATIVIPTSVPAGTWSWSIEITGGVGWPQVIEGTVKVIARTVP